MIGYWTTTVMVALALLGSLSYLTGNEPVVSGFAKAGYPQHLRIVLGMVKPAAAIVLRGLALLKEWPTRVLRSLGAWRSYRRPPPASPSRSASCRSRYLPFWSSPM
jgi:hypothetical protein